MGIRGLGNAKIFIGDQEIKGGISEINYEYESDPDPIKSINYEGSISGNMQVDIEKIEQLVARLTPYSSMFKNIKMPDGKYLVRGK